LVRLLYTEILKLKRSYMLLITLAGASVSPFINFLMFKAIERLDMDEVNNVAVIDFPTYADQTNFFIILIIGVMLYGLLTTYSFSREYQDDTLKSLLIIPINRTMFIISKCLLVFIWIMFLTIYTLGLSMVFALLGGFAGINVTNILQVGKVYLLTGFMMFLLVMPLMLLTSILKSYVASVAFTIGIVIVNLVIMNSEFLAIYPWSAPLRIVNPLINVATFPYWYSWVAILITGFLGILLTIIYFNRQDIQ